MVTEKIKFRLELYATMWHNPPSAEIKLNDISFFDSQVTGTEDNPTVIEFETELTEGTEYVLAIHRYAKKTGDTVVDQKGNILKDQILHIKNIEIDEINIGALVYEGIYTPTYPEPWATQQRELGKELPASFKNADSLGHNGVWKFHCASPFYMWLLENLY